MRAWSVDSVEAVHHPTVAEPDCGQEGQRQEHGQRFETGGTQVECTGRPEHEPLQGLVERPGEEDEKRPRDDPSVSMQQPCLLVAIKHWTKGLFEWTPHSRLTNGMAARGSDEAKNSAQSGRIDLCTPRCSRNCLSRN